jgi:ABC-type multidrug transport system fused ATPase/permease subunit
VLIVVLAYALSREQGGLAQAIPILGALALGAQKLLPQMQQVYFAWTAITGNRGELDDVVALLEAPIAPEYADAWEPAPLLPQPGQLLIALHRVSFRYHPTSPEVLRSIDLEIPRGMRVGIVGTTGSGKSTLIDIIMGLLPPSRGRVDVEGQPLTPQNLRSWQARIAHVPQAIYLTDATIAQNVALGSGTERIDWPRLEEAIRQAQLADFIDTLPEGLQTRVGERGVRLSGGQRQRIGLARALYKKADILVLDEATSALDSPTEQRVIASLESLAEAKTIFMVAHRLSTIQNSDRILVLDHGQIIGFDTWEALMATSAVFRHIASIGSTSPDPAGPEDEAPLDRADRDLVLVRPRGRETFKEEHAR